MPAENEDSSLPISEANDDDRGTRLDETPTSSTVPHLVGGENNLYNGNESYDDHEAIPLGCDAINSSLDLVLAACFSIDAIQPELSSPIPKNDDDDDDDDESSVGGNNCVAVAMASPTTPTHCFQRRGRFLIWPAAFGSDFNTRIST